MRVHDIFPSASGPDEIKDRREPDNPEGNDGLGYPFYPFPGQEPDENHQNEKLADIQQGIVAGKNDYGQIRVFHAPDGLDAFQGPFQEIADKYNAEKAHHPPAESDFGGFNGVEKPFQFVKHKSNPDNPQRAVPKTLGISFDL